MANAWARDRATPFYLSFGLAGLVIVGFGFGWTYAVPMVRRSFSAPWYVHLHGATALAWVLLFIGQPMLVRSRRTPLHRQLGQAAFPLALLVWSSGIATAVWAAGRDLKDIGAAATSALAGTATGLSVYVLLVAAAVGTRKRADWHKRLAMLATMHLLWPAFFRLRHWMPTIPDPHIWLALVFAYSPIVIAAARDKWRYGKVHPVWLFIAPVLVVEQSVEVAFFDKGMQRDFGQWLYAVFA
jgi:hypothetical protein